MAGRAIMTKHRIGTKVLFRENPAHHYEPGRIIGVSVQRGRDIYDVEAETGARLFDVTDIIEQRGAQRAA